MPAAQPRPLKRRKDLWFLRYGCLLFLLGFFGLCLLISALVTNGLFAEDPLIEALAFVLATATAVPYTLLLLWFDRNEQEPLHLIIIAFLWGANVATAISLVVNTTFGALAFSVVGNPIIAEQLTASFSAPFIEEMTKGAAVMFIFLLFRRDFDNVLDGILYGALVGMGFALSLVGWALRTRATHAERPCASPASYVACPSPCSTGGVAPCCASSVRQLLVPPTLGSSHPPLARASPTLT